MKTNQLGKNLKIYESIINKPKAVIIIAHGMMEHVGRYKEFVQYLNDNGFYAITFDQLGHGSKAYPALGHWEKGMFDESVENYHKIAKYSKTLYPELPIYLFAHSMGSFIAQEYIIKYSHDIDGLILSGSNSPMLLTKIGALITRAYSKYSTSSNKLLNDVMFKPYNAKFKPNRSSFDWLSSVEQEVDKYIKDPLCGFICSTGFFKEFIPKLADLSTPKKIRKIKQNLPILIISGNEDPVGQNGNGLRQLSTLYLKNGLKSVNLIIYPKARHELLNEFCKDKVMQDVVAWIKKIGV